MPTKPNRSGEQQNYVPPGNGDASGEYADNESGSNTHFTNFKKPDGETTEKKFADFKKLEKEGGEGIEIKPSNDKQTNFDDFVKNNFADKSGKLDDYGKKLTDDYNAGSDDAKHLVNVAIGSGVKIKKISGCSCYGGSVELSKHQMNDDGIYQKGETMYHEFWHCFDNIYATGTSDGKIKPLLTEKDINYISSGGSQSFNDLVNKSIMLRELSSSKVLSNGKTLFETWKEECHKRTLDRKVGKGWEEVINDFNKEKDEETLKLHPDYFEIKNKIKELSNKYDDEARKKYPVPATYDVNLINQRYDNIRKYVNEQKQNPEYAKLESKYKEMSKDREKIENKLKNIWMSVSDLYGIYNKVSYGFCGGHARNYGGRLVGAGAKEFMAEYGSAKSRSDENSKQELEKLKKYFPETSKMCEELQNMILEHSKKIGV